jgi:hypothetical protein
MQFKLSKILIEGGVDVNIAVGTSMWIHLQRFMCLLPYSFNFFLCVHRCEYIFIASYFYCHFLLNFFLFILRCFSRKLIVQEQLYICAQRKISTDRTSKEICLGFKCQRRHWSHSSSLCAYV